MTTTGWRWLPSVGTGLLLFSVACGEAPPAAITSAALSDTPFVIKALGDRCIGVTDTQTMGVVLTIQKCDGSPDQQFWSEELPYFDIKLRLDRDPDQCVTIDGPAGLNLQPGALLRPQPCVNTEAQRFAFDGDALLVGRQPIYDQPVSRDFVIEPLESITKEGTPVVVGTRELDDAEYWFMIPADGSETRPHSGFVTVVNEIDLMHKLDGTAWGNVIELDPPDDEVSIALDTFPIGTMVVRSGVTLRGRHKFVGAGVRLFLPPYRIPEQGFVLRVDNHARVTQLRMEGVPHGGCEDEKVIWALQVGLDEKVAPYPTNVIIDHVDLSRWSGSAIVMFGGHFLDPETAHACPEEPRSIEPSARIVGNFIHHLEHAYGVAVAAGAYAYVRGNYMFGSAHEVASAFHTAENRYVAFDNLFTGDDNTILDVHGNCDRTDWVGGRAGDYFEAAFNTFLTKREHVDVRGTPCDHFSFHHNQSIRGEEGATGVRLDPGGSCGDLPPFPVPGDPNVILQAFANEWEIDNPMDHRLAIGDFDGDRIDDVFVATGVTWWFSSGGKAEWRFLNRMQERVADLRFGDFDDDGRTDVVTVHGGDQLSVSWAGASGWFPLNASPVGAPFAIGDIAVGEFDAAGGDDLLFANSVEWHWAPQGAGDWQPFAAFEQHASELRFGDFDGDGITEVFRTEDGTWFVVRGPQMEWEELASEQVSASIDRIVVADFDGDGFADVGADMPVLGMNVWMVSSRGVSSPDSFALDEQRMSLLPIGDFDRNDAPNGADVLRWTDERFWLISPFADEMWSTQAMR